MSREYVLQPFQAPVEFQIDYAKELNPQQHAAVTAPPGPALVIAGAGSGKTRTLTYRVARLIESGVPPERILLLTFTNKAAREMIRRVHALLPGETRRVTGGTFHHVGNLILRRHASLVGYSPTFAILDREDAREFMDEFAAAASTQEGYMKFPKGDVLLSILSFARNTGTTVDRLIGERYPVFGE